MVLTERFICSFISKRSAGAVFFRRILTHFSELQVTVFVYRVSILGITRMSGYIFKLTSFRRLKNVHEKSVLWDGRHFEKPHTHILVHIFYSVTHAAPNFLLSTMLSEHINLICIFNPIFSHF